MKSKQTMSSMNSSSSLSLKGYYPATHYTNSVAWCIAFGMEAFFVVLFNGLTIVTFVTTKRMRQRRSMYCLVNLAVADLSVGLLTMPLYVAYLADNLLSKWRNFLLEHCLDVIYQFTASVANFSLVLVALERVYVTVWPLRHRRTGRRAYLSLIATTWLIALANTLIYYALKYQIKRLRIIFYVLLPVLLISLFLICVSYAVILIKMRNRNEHQVLGAVMPRRLQKERKLAHTLFLVTATSLITWLPFAIMQILSFGGHLSVSADAVFGVLLIQCINSLVNPIIYIFRIREFRNALLQLGHCKKSSAFRRHKREFIHLAKIAVPIKDDTELLN